MIFKTCAPVNRAMAIQAGPTEKSVAGAASGKSCCPVIGGAGMAGPVMTVLAKIGNFFGQQFCMPAAMRCVTDGTIFPDGGMLIDIWPPFVGMALIAELVYILRIDHTVGRLSAMGIMTITALNLAFLDRVMRTLADFSSF